MQTVTVSGGAGFIGSHLCEELLRGGAEVFCLDNLITGVQQNIASLLDDPKFHFIECDITNGVPTDLPAMDVIFNLACPASPKDFAPLAIQILRVCSEGTLNMLQLARKHGAIFVQASTSEVYGEPQVHPQREDYWGHVNPIGERSCYDEGKRYAEALAMAYRRLHGVDARLARIFNSYGPRMRPDDGRVAPNFILQALAGEALTIYGDGTQTRGFCYVTDTVAALLALAGVDKCAVDDACPAYNIGSGDEHTILEFAEHVKRVCQSNSRLELVPLPHADEPTRRCPDTSKLQATTGWEPTISLQEGLEQTLRWLEQQLQA